MSRARVEWFKRGAAAAACALTCASWTPAQAQGDPTEQAYAAAFGAGLQSWAESNYVSAVMHLSRAYALKPDARPLRMVVRSYDMMGHCSAALQQQRLLEAEHGQDSKAELQRCADPAHLAVRCEMSEAQVVVDGTIRTTCGTTLLLPPGAHDVVVPGHDLAQRVVLSAGQRASLDLKVSPRKWPEAMARAGSGARVPRILDDADRYTVYMSRDGLYQIWVRHDAPDLLEPYGAGGQAP